MVKIPLNHFSYEKTPFDDFILGLPEQVKQLLRETGSTISLTIVVRPGKKDSKGEIEYEAGIFKKRK